MEFTELAPNGPVIMTPVVHTDQRGFFLETFRLNDFQQYCGNYNFVQDNHSRSTANVLRGLHYQLHHPQGKLIRVVVGEVFDVAVDLRQSSPNFGKWYSVRLSAENKKMFWVPPGFAHGFLVLSEIAEFLYKCTDYYAPGDEYCLIYNDKTVGVEWPRDDGLLLSEKDLLGMTFEECENFY